MTKIISLLALWFIMFSSLCPKNYLVSYSWADGSHNSGFGNISEYCSFPCVAPSQKVLDKAKSDAAQWSVGPNENIVILSISRVR